MPEFLTLDALRALQGKDPVPTRWEVLDQARIDAFADVTGDPADIHVAPESDAARDFGGTIAHGFLTLSLLTSMVYQAMPGVKGYTGLNYGFDRVRFVAPVPTGSRVRGHLGLHNLTHVGEAQLQLTWDVRVEIENTDRPALVAQWLGRFIKTENAEQA